MQNMRSMVPPFICIQHPLRSRSCPGGLELFNTKTWQTRVLLDLKEETIGGSVLIFLLHLSSCLSICLLLVLYILLQSLSQSFVYPSLHVLILQALCFNLFILFLFLISHNQWFAWSHIRNHSSQMNAFLLFILFCLPYSLPSLHSKFFL